MMTGSSDMIIQKCPKCDNNIKIGVVKIHGGVNDYGGMLVKCDNCGQQAYTKLKNPYESYVTGGGKKVGYWDDEITSETDFLNAYKDVLPLQVGVRVHGDINKREVIFDTSKTSIYFCPHCKKSIEEQAYKALEDDFQNIQAEHSNLNSYALKGYAKGDKLVVKLPFKCHCNHSHEAFFYTSFAPGYSLNDINELLLFGTNFKIDSLDLDRICAKTECIEILEKFLVRWNFIYPKVLIATPFVGHQWMKDEDLLKLWDWIVNNLDPLKTIFITRKATFNKYKKTFEKSTGISLEFLEDYDLDSKVISNYTSKQDFHAKIFAGLSQEAAEVLSGSFNLLKGKSVENLAYNKYEGTTFMQNFIAKMNLPVELDKLQESACLIIEKDNINSFVSRQTQMSSIYTEVL